MADLTDNLDEQCYSLRDFLAVIAAARVARHPLDEVADRLLDMVGEAEAGPNCRTCGRTEVYCDAEPRSCCEVCAANGHADGPRT